MMKNMKDLEQKLRRADRKQAALYLLCNFLSLMLITAYSALMLSPTVQTIFPNGGDSRKQMYAIFILALFGCAVFTVYAATLFFRKKSRQLGVLMALGASRARLTPGLFLEVLLLSGVSSLAGIVAGFPFLLLLWNAFRITMFDTAEMVLTLDFTCLLVSAAFFLLVVACACVLALIYLRRTNIMDVVQEEHKNEPVKELGLWCGPVGILLFIGGAVLGYNAELIYRAVFQKYGPVWLNLAYLPVFIGLYMIMLHTVVHGWTRRKKHPYKNIISRSMMKFQGRQTVTSLLVCTVLIAGGCFGIFYMPMMISGLNYNLNQYAYDYAFHAPADQKVPGPDEVKALAAQHGLGIKDWVEAPFAILGCDGTIVVEEADDSFHYEYEELVGQGRFYSESSYTLLTGQKVDVPAGRYMGITTNDGVNTYSPSPDCTLFTNMCTRETLPVEFEGYLNFQLMADSIEAYVLDDADYKTITQGLTPQWLENQVYFNADGEDSYAFANALFHAFAASFDEEYATSTFHDRVRILAGEERGEPYFEGYEDELYVNLDNPDSSDFRMKWTYMPRFRILESNDTLQTYAVFFMTFVFIAIICITSALVIAYTRCQTIALNNRYIFEDLRKLGASPGFLTDEVQRQCSTVYRIPSAIGMTAMIFLFSMILYANDGGYALSELIGFALCMGIMIIVGAIIFGVYTHTVHKLCAQLDIRK